MNAPVLAISPSRAKSGRTDRSMQVFPAGQIGDELQRIHQLRGRPTAYTPERAAQVIAILSDGGTMRGAAEELGVARQTIWEWSQAVPEFLDEIRAAREVQAHCLADDALELVDGIDTAHPDHKQVVVQARKAEIQARVRLQLAECYHPAQYARKQMSTNINLNANVDPVDLAGWLNR